MTHEEELRASHQLAFLKFQEKTLVENARSEMAWLEALKKKLRDKGADKKASLIKKRQKDIILRLRQERAQLRCMQEAYRSICEKHRSLMADKRKLLGDQSLLLQTTPTKRKEQPSSSKHSSEMRSSNISKRKSNSSSTSAVLTEEEIKRSEEEILSEVIQEISPTTNSSQGSVIESGSNLVSEPAQSPSLSAVSQKLSPATPMQQEHSQSSLSINSGNSIEAAVQGLKKLEASKRHLTKREQRILQRRKHVEKLLQWQTKLDSEEMAVRELEQKAVALVDTSKRKTRHYVSTTSASAQEQGGIAADGADKFLSASTSDVLDGIAQNLTVGVSDTLSSQNIPTLETSGSAQSNSIPEENLTVSSRDSVEEDKGSSSHENSIPEMDVSKSSESSVKTVESSPPEEISSPNEQTSSPKSPLIKKSTSSETYSESFESTATQKNLTPSPVAPVVKTSTPNSGGRKDRTFNIKSPLTPRNMRRQDSSGSDDSYTISLSETDQSDIEVRIHALAEQLRQRKFEAEKLKREQKRKYREHLRGKELSLQKQVETYNQIIQQVKADLEQFEAMSSQTPSDVTSVRPQIKWPRPVQVIDSSRRVRKQTSQENIPASGTSSLDSLEKKGKLSEEKAHSSTSKIESTETKVSSGQSSSEVDNSKPTSFESVEIVENLSAISNTVHSSTETALNTLTVVPESKEETEIEEESYESSVSSIVTVDSVSEKHKTSIEDKITFESGSSEVLSTLVTEKSTGQKDQPTSSIYEDVEPHASEKLTSKETTESNDNHQESDKSPSSVQTGTHESLPSSEVEYSSITDSSVKEYVESGSFESYEYSSPSPGSKSDNTSPTESISAVEETHSKKEGEVPKDVTQTSEANKHSISVISTSHLPLKEVLKSETFVVNVVNFLQSSMLNDALRNILNLSRKSSMSNEGDVVKSGHFLSSKKKRNLEAVTSGIVSNYIDDAISCILNIANNYHKSGDGPKSAAECHEWSSKSSSAQESAVAVYQGDGSPSDSAALVQDKSESTIFKKQIDWFDDGLVAAQWTNQQLEQQVLLQQYPYYYRKIPNKPPPPYTPPAAATTPVLTHLPLPIRRDKSAEKPDPIKLITNNIDAVVQCVADAFMGGKNEGLSVRDIACPSFSNVIEKLELKMPCQLTFLDLLFDLAKEIVLDVYNETPPVPQPWLKPRKLAPKPLFPSDRDPLVAVLRREMDRALKLKVGDPEDQRAKRRRPTRAAMKLGRRKRDFVDTVLIGEIGQEEPDWVHYDEDEVTVKCRVADAVFDLLIDETVQLLKGF